MIFAKSFARNYEKKNDTWNIRRLVNERIVPSTQRIILKIAGFLYHFKLWVSGSFSNASELSEYTRSLAHAVFFLGKIRMNQILAYI